VPAGCRLVFANGGGRLQTVYFGHLHVHEDEIETLLLECG
jgi:hypothetical protein